LIGAETDIKTIAAVQRFKPKSVKSVILCSNGDATLLPLLASFANVTVEVMKLSPISVDAFESPATASPR
jgi:hypothetical protein